ncbi:rhodanese-like domain-containing protein [Rhodovulum sp. DZ06]|uniref:rhodanese-like domain-containing protein n=1 Tax=Rhodovulum sp. DZ06 TaxID=3425126 RepID=UPI003D339251
MRLPLASALFGLAALVSAPASAQEVWITPDMPFFEFEVEGKTYAIEREQDTEHTITNSFAKTSRPCPPFCVQPAKVADGVETVGELEIISFLETEVTAGTGYLVDARVQSWFERGTIPGSVNLPFTVFANDPSNPFLDSISRALGGTLLTSGQWDFSNAKKLLMFCNGPWCGQSPRAIRNLISLGYPPEKLLYYRGGMQAWQSMGFNVIVPNNPQG